VARTNQTMQLQHKQTKKNYYIEKFPGCHASIIDSTKVKGMTAWYVIMQHVQNFWTRGTIRTSLHDAAENLASCTYIPHLFTFRSSQVT